MAIRIVRIDAEECTCEKCGHIWIPKPEFDKQAKEWFTRAPNFCSKCKDGKWNRPIGETAARA
jgi:hypothetical protein